MPNTEEILLRYEALAAETARQRAQARAALEQLLARLTAEPDFEARLQELAWSAASSRNDSAALRFANDGLQPKKEFLQEVRSSGSYLRELTRLNYNDSGYIFAQRALKHPQEFLTQRGLKLLRRLAGPENRSELARLTGQQDPGPGIAFAAEYMASLELSALTGAVVRQAVKAAEERFKTTRVFDRALIRSMVLGELPDDEREFLIYRVLDLEGFSGLSARAADAATGLLPGFDRAEAVSAALNASDELALQLQDAMEAAELDHALAAGLMSSLSQERILELLAENDRCRDLAAEERARWAADLRRRQELTYNIVTAMPDSYKDLYPATRQMQRHFVVHSGPTNSGKTYAGMQALMRHGSGVYLSPLRMLALEKADELNEAGCLCDLRTGEEERLVEGASFVSSTVELADLSAKYDCAVIDECQMMTDPVRGGAWTAAVLGLQAGEIHVCLSPWAVDILIPLIEDCADTYEIVTHERACPLYALEKPIRFPEDIRPHDALIAFSRKSVHAIASRLEQAGMKCSIIYGNLPYDVRQNEAEKIRTGKT